MSKKEFALLYLLGLAVYAGVAAVQTTPGYMDAQYYYAGALQLVEGKGWTEPYLWNTMNITGGGLPIPSFLYWMPLPSLLAAAGMFIFRSESYLAARIPFILFAALIPVLTAYWTGQFVEKKKYIWLGGVIGLIGGYYLPFITHTDTFTPYFVLGAIFFLLTKKLWNDRSSGGNHWVLAGVLGILAGCMHLTRADGILWLGAACFVILLREFYLAHAIEKTSFDWKSLTVEVLLIFAGYLLIMGGWYARNIRLFDGVFPPDNGRNLWLTQYNDLFLYPASKITGQRWIESGFGTIFATRLKAGGMNLENLLAVIGGLILLPFMVWGCIKLRKNRILQLVLFLLLIEFCVMTIVFPFAGGRGGFFHSGSAFQILLWAVVPVGFAEFLNIGIKKRGWTEERAWKMFGSALIIGFVLLTGFIFSQKMNGNSTNESWTGQEERYQRMAITMKSLALEDDSPVMVGNPPGYYLASRQSAVVIPDGGPEAILQFARQFGVKYILMDKDHTPENDDFYDQRVQDPNIQLVKSGDGFKIFKVIQ